MPEFYPALLNLKGRPCLVVGGGKVAERKTRSLLSCAAKVKLVSPRLTPGLQELAAGGQITYLQREFQPSDLEGVFLVVAATDSKEVNRRVAREALARNLLVNVVNDPQSGNFYVPATVRRGPLQIAVSTSGRSPLLARKIRERLEGEFGPAYGCLAEFLGEIRRRAREESAGACLGEGQASPGEEILLLVKRGELELAKERVCDAYCGRGGKPQDGTGRGEGKAFLCGRLPGREPLPAEQPSGG
ncbi:precorrin-2 dehydrogenase/sirohydrochlorin ferrochelatase family protein [Desulfovirgula thermocuniculi]|uniref:precorrin-2 dehydrogenase/sirohydrochlorin ferrochelatase family protein n=1 Tax=Desulfovirgula thermocuniculi TaxID=348842 RepID=UPI000405EE69|nr:bifunctional precorrin-2 dehydrogenase/sirohydrochlorin ferrochelatase [Desulfovirgula thermocuniculi]